MTVQARCGLMAALGASFGVWASLAPALAADGEFKYLGAGIEMHVSVRKADQMTSFYFGRGFSAEAVAEIAKACFITVGFKHHRPAPIWLEPAHWRIVAADGTPVKRLGRDYWNARFAAVNAPAADRATFGWTQLPEVRDLQTDEPVGGNLTIQPPPGTFTILARFATGADKRGPDLLIKVPDLQCSSAGKVTP